MGVPGSSAHAARIEILSRSFSKMQPFASEPQTFAKGNVYAPAQRVAAAPVGLVGTLAPKRLPSRAFQWRRMPPMLHVCFFQGSARAHQCHNHHQPELQRVGQRLRRRKDDHRLARPAYPYCHILETGNDSFRFKNSSAHEPKTTKEKSRSLTTAPDPETYLRGGSVLDANAGSLLCADQQPLFHKQVFHR